MTQELTVRQSEVGIFLPPDLVLENAKKAAQALTSVIKQKPNPVIMNGEQYLEFEDWQLVGQFYGYSVRTGDAVPVEIDGVKGAKAHADLIDKATGLSLGGAEAYCMRDEDRWNTRPKYEWRGEGKDRHRAKVGDEIVPWFQLASMAQTRAGSKALRNRVAWVVVLAGYKATPAEEMTEGIVSSAVEERRTVESDEHWCAEHHTAFFKKGKMKGYAHHLPDGSWHNEPSDKAKPVTATQSPPEAPQATQAGDKPPVAEEGGQQAETAVLPNGLRPDDVRQQLHDLQWTPHDLNETLNRVFKPLHFRVAAGHLDDLAKLSREQAVEFVAMLDERRRMQ